MKKKLKIQELKIQSFVTELDSATAKTAKGGDDGDTKSTVSYTAISALSWNIYTDAAKANSWWPYANSTECTKVTTTTATSTVKH